MGIAMVSPEDGPHKMYARFLYARRMYKFLYDEDLTLLGKNITSSFILSNASNLL